MHSLRLNFENWGRKFNSNNPLFFWQLSLYWYLPFLDRQKGPTATFRPKGLCPLFITAFSPFMAHHNISLLFRAGGRRVKNSVFHEFVFHFVRKNCRPAAASILMPPTFHIATLNHYTPKFSGVAQKLTGSQDFVLRVLPNWDDADFCHLEKAVIRFFFY